MDTVGRDRELAEIAAFLGSGAAGPDVLLLDGDAGIGKTTVWRAVLEKARADGFRVLACAGVSSETQLSFTGLRDLLDQSFDEIADELPPPQRRALGVVLLREEGMGAPPQRDAIAVAFLSTLRLLASNRPTLVAVDDVQWVDAASAASMAYALRRAISNGAKAFLSRRTNGDEVDALALDRLAPERLRVLRLAPLSVGAVGRILHDRLGASYPRPTLKRIHDVSAGNPFFALELGRALSDSGRPLPPGAALPVPRTLSELVETRLTALPTATLDVLVIASALWRPTISLVEKTLGGDPRPLLDPAVDAHIADVDGETIRFAHPLFAAAVYGLAPSGRRRDLHRQLAEVASDVEERARHLALATDGQDAAVADSLEQAAQTAFARGAIDSAAALAEQSLRFTDDAEVGAFARRQLAAAGYLARAGSTLRARELIDAARAAAAPGPDRARIALGLAWWGLGDNPTRIAAVEEAIQDAQEDPRLLAQVHAVLGCILHPEIDVAAAERHAVVALELAEHVGEPAILVLALGLAERIDFYAGRGVDVERVERALALEVVGANPWGEISVMRFFRGHQFLATGDLDAARSWFEALAAEGEHRGDSGYADVLVGLAVVEVRAGNWERAQQLGDGALEIARDVDAVEEAWCHWPLTLVAALRGDAVTARAAGARGLRLADGSGSLQVRAHLSAALGLLELSLGNAETAHSHLAETARLVRRMQLREPGLVPFVPDYVEALVAIGEVEAAEAAAAELEEQGRRLARRAALAGAARCRGLIAAARGDLPAAVDMLETARREAAVAGQPFELARALLALGAVQRRMRKRAAARETLNRALAIFEELGAELWADTTLAELGRIGGRSAASGELTPTETRIAELVAEGKTNREVAAVLVVADRTVESALTQIYRKLDVRSRTELARKLVEG